MAEVAPEKCNALYGDEAGSITDSKRVELTDAWETNNLVTINAVAGDIANAMAQFNREVGTDPRLSGLLWTQSEINSFTDPRTWDYGGADGYGEFGESGEIVQALETKKEVVRQILDGYVISQANLDLVPLLTKLQASITLTDSFFGSSYSAVREAYLERYQIDKCFLDSEISRLEPLNVSDEALLQARSPSLSSYVGEIRSELRDLKDKLADLEAGNLETENIGRRLFEGKTLEFKEQCFLLSNIFNLAKIKEQFDHGVSGSARITTSPATPLEKPLPYSTANANNSTVMANGVPFAFMNQMTQSPTKDAFFEMNNAQLSSLQPMIRLYKVIPQEGDAPNCPVEKQVEIKFDPSATQYGLGNMKVQDFLKDRNYRNPGVGLKSFNFTYDGYNPYAIKKSISAKLVIHANSFNELIRERKNAGSDDVYRYIDLVLKTGGQDTIQYNRQQSDVAISNLEKLNFRLKVVMGWENPMFTNRGIFKSDVLQGINNQAVTLNLTPTIHDFAFDDMGRVTMTVDYLAYIEDYYDSPGFNIFSSTLPTLRTLSRSLEYQTLNKKCDKAELDSRKQDDLEEEKIKEDKKQMMRSLFSSMLNSQKIYNISIKPDEIPIFGNGGPYGRASALYNTDDLLRNIRNTETGEFAFISQAIETAGNDVQPEAEEQETVNEPLTNYIVFFYAGDLVDIILKNIDNSLKYVLGNLNNPNSSGLFATVEQSIIDEEIEKYKRYIENFKKLRILLGPLEIVKPNSNDTTITNLGDIPISFKHFIEWLTTKLLDKNIETFTLPNFLNSFFNQYIIDYLNQDICYGGKAKQKINLNQTAVTEHRDGPGEKDTISKWCDTYAGLGGNPSGRDRTIKCPAATTPIGTIQPFGCTRRLYIPQTLPDDKYPIMRVMGVRDDPRSDTGVCNEINYLAYYAGRTIPVDEMKGNKADDHAKGIWHYQIGKDRGIVKSINLQKTDTPGLAEVRFEQDGYDGLRQLRVVYDVTIKTYLDVSLFPESTYM